MEMVCGILVGGVVAVAAYALGYHRGVRVRRDARMAARRAGNR